MWIRYTSVGMEFTITFLAGLALGYWLDGIHGPRPAYMLVMGALGFGAGLYRLIRQAMRMRNETMQPPGKHEDKDQPGDPR